MIENKLIAAFGACLLITSNFILASDENATPKYTVTDVDNKRLDAMINKALKAFGIPGTAVGIILFAIGSCTKAFTR